ncbi:hypothetical protein FRAHR75_1120004 [Frankia sp. Hr75.2]|nr:hypothetical protein FRAHR75_1120004 [Frankia sp. Hr75.2]
MTPEPLRDPGAANNGRPKLPAPRHAADPTSVGSMTRARNQPKATLKALDRPRSFRGRVGPGLGGGG